MLTKTTSYFDFLIEPLSQDQSTRRVLVWRLKRQTSIEALPSPHRQQASPAPVAGSVDAAAQEDEQSLFSSTQWLPRIVEEIISPMGLKPTRPWQIEVVRAKQSPLVYAQLSELPPPEACRRLILALEYMMTSNAFDPVVVRRFALVHPLNLPALLSQFRLVLGATTGLGPGNEVFAGLSAIRTVGDLSGVDWQEMDVQIWENTTLPERVCSELVEHVRLFAVRATLHHRLFLAQSATTLQLLGRPPLPMEDLPCARRSVEDAFAQTLVEADSALRSGRARLQEFGSLALHGESLARLPGLLEQVSVCYTDYCQAMARGDGFASDMKWETSRVEARAAWAAA